MSLRDEAENRIRKSVVMMSLTSELPSCKFKSKFMQFVTETVSKAQVLLDLLSQYCLQEMFAFFVKMCEFFSAKNSYVVFNAFYFAKHQVIHKVVITAFPNVQWISPDLVDTCFLCAVSHVLLWSQNMGGEGLLNSLLQCCFISSKISSPPQFNKIFFSLQVKWKFQIQMTP